MATKTYTAHDFTPGQVVTISRRVLSVLAGRPGRVTRVDTEKNTVNVIATTDDGEQKVVTFTPNWLTPSITAEVFEEGGDFGRWATFIGEDGTRRPVTFVGFSRSGLANYVEGHIDIKVTAPRNITI